MKRLILPALASFLLLACGGSAKKVESPTLPPANPHALNTMEQGVQAAKQPGGGKKAIGLFRSAVKTIRICGRPATTWECCSRSRAS